MVPEEIALEDRVVFDQPVIVVGDVRPQDCRGKLRMIVRRKNVADVVQQRAEHGLLVGRVARRARRGLQRMAVAVDLVAERVSAKALQHGENLVRQSDLMRLPVLVEKLVVLVGAFIHADEADRAAVHDRLHAAGSFPGSFR